MSNNDVLKKLRVALHLRNDEISEILALSGFTITRSELNALFRKDDHPNFKKCGDQILRKFLDGLIIYKRGARDTPKSEKPKDTSDKKNSNSDKSKKRDMSYMRPRRRKPSS